MNTDLISIIIVNYNGIRFLKNCLNSVFIQTYSPFEVIFVDNASKDESVVFVRENYPTIRVIESKENLGFAGGNNLGVRHAKGKLIVLLNNDTIAEQHWLSALVEAVQPEDVAIVSSLILTEGIPQKYYEQNGSINFLGHNIMRIFSNPEDIFFAGGASLIYKKKIIIGDPFDDEYFAYGEDVFLSLRARFLDYKVVHTNNSVVKHFGSGTSGSEKSALWTFYQERNRLLNTFLFFSQSTLYKIAPLILINIAGKLIASLIGNKYSSVGLVRAYSWILFNVGWIGEKKHELAKEKRIDETKVICDMTCKLTNGESCIGRSINYVSKIYFQLVNIRTIEFNGDKE